MCTTCAKFQIIISCLVMYMCTISRWENSELQVRLRIYTKTRIPETNDRKYVISNWFAIFKVRAVRKITKYMDEVDQYYNKGHKVYIW